MITASPFYSDVYCIVIFPLSIVFLTHPHAFLSVIFFFSSSLHSLSTVYLNIIFISPFFLLFLHHLPTFSPVNFPSTYLPPIPPHYHLTDSLLLPTDTPPPAYSPSEDIKQTQPTDTPMETVPSSTSILSNNVTPVTYQVRFEGSLGLPR